MPNPLRSLPVDLRVLGAPHMLAGTSAEQLAMAVVQSKEIDGRDIIAAVDAALEQLTEAVAVLQRIRNRNPEDAG